MGEQRIMRVIVRGRFAELSDPAIAYLRANRADHDVTNSAYTVDGTLTYDAKIDYFSIRYETRLGDDEPDGLAAERAVGEADQFLRIMGFGHRPLKANVTDVAALRRRPAS